MDQVAWRQDEHAWPVAQDRGPARIRGMCEALGARVGGDRGLLGAAREADADLQVGADRCARVDQMALLELAARARRPPPAARRRRALAVLLGADQIVPTPLTRAADERTTSAIVPRHPEIVAAPTPGGKPQPPLFVRASMKMKVKLKVPVPPAAGGAGAGAAVDRGLPAATPRAQIRGGGFRFCIHMLPLLALIQ